MKKLLIKKMNLLDNRFNKKKYYFLKKNFIYPFIIIILIFFLDRYTKIQILNNYDDSTIYLNYFINFDLIWNTGIGFGLFSYNSSLIYSLFTLVIGIVLLYLIYISINSELIDTMIFSIIIGGALGNFYDRLIFNAVPDFIDLHYMNYHWFTFNVADIFISIGIISFLLKGFFNKKK